MLEMKSPLQLSPRHRALQSGLAHTAPRQPLLPSSACSFSAAREATRGGSISSVGTSRGLLLVYIRRGADDAEVLPSHLKLLSCFSMLGVVR